MLQFLIRGFLEVFVEASKSYVITIKVESLKATAPL
jgi:hypothetical protein